MFYMSICEGGGAKKSDRSSLPLLLSMTTGFSKEQQLSINMCLKRSVWVFCELRSRTSSSDNRLLDAGCIGIMPHSQEGRPDSDSDTCKTQQVTKEHLLFGFSVWREGIPVDCDDFCVVADVL